jgi:hypothetical protein
MIRRLSQIVADHFMHILSADFVIPSVARNLQEFKHAERFLATLGMTWDIQ